MREFSLAAGRVLRRVIPFDGICLMTMDPATLLPTGHVIENGLPADATLRLADIELQGSDFNRFTDLARRRSPAASLSEATGGNLERSQRQRELRRPHGFEDELRAALATESGTWGGIVLMREARRAYFDHAAVHDLASLAGALADGLADSAALSWLVELEHDGALGEQPPVVVHMVADRARRNAAGAGNARATARVRTRSGRWLIVRGSLLGGGPETRAAVILEPARLPELAPLIAEAYRLTPRERAITQLVAQGFSTGEISDRLLLSPYTVQDRLKTIFEKADVSSRGALVARLFFEHYAPRLAAGAQIGYDGWFVPAQPDRGG